MKKSSSKKVTKFWVVESRHGHKCLSILYPFHDILLDDTSDAKEKRSQLDLPDPLCEIVNVLTVWQEKLKEIADLPIDVGHFYVYIVDFSASSTWFENHPKSVFYDKGEPFVRFEVIRGKYDNVIICVHPDIEYSRYEMEKFVLKELIHVCLPYPDLERILFECEAWAAEKAKELYEKFGPIT